MTTSGRRPRTVGLSQHQSAAERPASPWGRFAFKACGLAKPIKHSPKAPSTILSLIQFVDPSPDPSWMTETLVLWEGAVDERTFAVTATAYEWRELTTSGAAAATA
jgi:hypothetical protein